MYKYTYACDRMNNSNESQTQTRLTHSNVVIYLRI